MMNHPYVLFGLILAVVAISLFVRKHRLRMVEKDILIAVKKREMVNDEKAIRARIGRERAREQWKLNRPVNDEKFQPPLRLVERGIARLLRKHKLRAGERIFGGDIYKDYSLPPSPA